MKWMMFVLLFIAAPTFAEVRVCVEPPPVPTGLRSEEDQQTAKILVDADKVFREKISRKKNIVLVTDKCQVTVQLIDQRWQSNGRTTTTFGRFNAKSSEDGDRVLVATLRSGEYSTEVIGLASPRLVGYWKAAAGGLANRVEDWIKLNGLLL